MRNDDDDPNGNVVEPHDAQPAPEPAVSLPQPVQQVLSVFTEPVRQWLTELVLQHLALQRTTDALSVRLAELEGTVDHLSHSDATNGQVRLDAQCVKNAQRLDALEGLLRTASGNGAGADRGTPTETPPARIVRRTPPPRVKHRHQLPVGWEGWQDELAVLPAPPTGRQLTPGEINHVRRCMHEVLQRYDAETLAEFQAFLAQYYRTTPEAITRWFSR